MDNKVLIKRTYDSKIEDVFDAWVDSDKLSAWHAPKGKTSSAKVTGEESYEITFHDPKEDDQTAKGTYKEFDRPNKLVFTWSWHMPGGASPETLVTINFKEVEGKTELELVHEGFSDKKETEHHNQGWTSVLDSLGNYLDK